MVGAAFEYESPEFLDAGDDYDHHDHDLHHDHDGNDHGHGGLKHYHDEVMQSLLLRSDKPLDPTERAGIAHQVTNRSEYTCLSDSPN